MTNGNPCGIAGGRAVKQVCDVLGVARSNVSVKLARPADWQDGRSARKTDDAGLVDEIRLLIADLPSYGYRRVWGMLRCERESRHEAPVNAKRVYRVMRVHDLLLHSWAATTGGHSGDVVRDVMLAAVEHRFGNVRKAPAQIEWLSDNGSGYIAEKTRAFASDIGLKPLTTPVCTAEQWYGGKLPENHEARLRRVHAQD